MSEQERPAGRELDRLIGEKVFGYSVYRYDKGPRGSEYWTLMNGDYEPVVSLQAERQSEEAAWADCPAFSTDIGAAWLIVERLKRKDLRGYELFELHWGPYGAPISVGPTAIMMGDTHELAWLCSFDPYVGIRAVADSAPLAICRAALKVIEREAAR